MEPDYWQTRLFKSTYTYDGRRRRVRHWSIKIQHRSKRRTFSLSSGDPTQAAAEACRIYHLLLKYGWKKSTEVLAEQRAQEQALADGQSPAHDPERLEYWEQRLIRRQYSMNFVENSIPEYSVRLEYGSASHYLPLGTNNQKQAARRALQFYRRIASHGWDAFNRRNRRELTLAFRWLDGPLAWTYTTIHTQVNVTPTRRVMRGNEAKHAVAVVEADPGIRNALEVCLNHMEHFYCVGSYFNPQQALWEITRRPPHLVLVSHGFARESGAILLDELKAAAPHVAGLLYSVYDDSEELFSATPGGLGTYLLQRCEPTQFLEPILTLLNQRSFSPGEMATGVWQYFLEHVSRLPISSAGRSLTDLTQREHEVLALLSRGHPDKDIADRLAISVYTVHEHVRNIFEKLGVHNRTEAVVRFLQK